MSNSTANNTLRDQGVSLEFVAILLDDAACRWKLSPEQSSLLFLCAETNQRVSNELDRAADEAEIDATIDGGEAA